MNISIKYILITVGFLIPITLDYLFQAGMGKNISLLLPGIVIALYLEIKDTQFSIKEAFGFLSTLSQYNIKGDVDKIAESFQQIDRFDDDLFYSKSVSALKEATGKISRIRDGEIDIVSEVELTNMPTTLMNDVKNSLLATVLWREDTLQGEGGSGKAYLAAMKGAIGRGAVIKRVFILSKTDTHDDLLDDPRLIQRLKADQGDNIHVRYMYEDTWLNLFERQVVDFGVWDRRLVWVFGSKVAQKRPAQIINRKQDIDSHIELFEALWKESKEYIG